jgi:sigma-B regulation protein RsbU (phosphoserine phosphatase)
LPIISQQNRVLGVVEVLNKRGGDAFTGEDEVFLRAISTHLALALQRAELVNSYVQAEKMQQYLKLAHEIQMGLVPTVFPGCDKPQLDVYAVLAPALEVGGDLYDFFFLDDNRVCFVIGDVSDKGVPAALFMAITRTAFKISAVANSGAVAATLETVNRFLCERNDSQMFVTVFCGILDLRTGVVEYSDGGHEPPFVIRHGERAELLEKKGGMALGFMDGIPYPTGYVELNPGDALLLYTDGVNEALNAEGRMFHVSGIERTLNSYLDGRSAEEMVTRLVGDVAQFVGSAPQSDDITILALKYEGPL